MPSSRKCVFPGCRNLQSSSVTLFKFPRDEQLKRRWMDFVVGHGDRELKITTNTRLCSDHFTPESFTNFQRRLLGFTDNPLLLVTGAAPTVSMPGLHPAAPTVSLPGLHPAAPTISLPGLHPAAPPLCPPNVCQCGRLQTASREVGCQTDLSVGKRTVATQQTETRRDTKNTELPQQHVCQQEETLTDQERSSIEPPHIKEEVEEVCSSHLELKLDSDAFMLTPGSEEQLCNHEGNLNLHRDDREVQRDMEEVCTGQEGEQFKLRLDTFMLTQPYEKREHTESQRDEQPLFDNSDEAQSKDEDGDGDEDSTQNAAPKPKRGRPSNAERHRKSFQRDTCGKEFNFKYEYKEETDRQCGLLDVVWKPELRLHRIELPQQHVCQQEETLTDQERSSREPPHIKVEVEEVCSSQLELKLDSDAFMLTPGSEEQLCNHEGNLNLHRDDREVQRDMEEVCTGQEREQFKLRLDTFMLTQPYEKREHTESQSDEQPLFDNSDEAQSKDEDGGGLEDSKTRNAVLKPKRGRPPNAEKHRKSFQCDTCGKECKSKNRLDNHLKMHTNGVKLWWCNICGKDFGLRSALNDHIKSHPGEGQFFCSTCGKGFTYRSHLSTHARTHRGLKLHLCKRCGKTFAFDSALKVHMRTHTDERPHTCKTCGKGFRALSSLEIHMRTHTDERPFLCKTCGKGFRQRAHLTAHLSTHTGEKPYPCDVCGKNYGSLSILSKHRKMHAKSLEATVDQRSMPTAPVNMASVILNV